MAVELHHMAQTHSCRVLTTNLQASYNMSEWPNWEIFVLMHILLLFIDAAHIDTQKRKTSRVHVNK